MMDQAPENEPQGLDTITGAFVIASWRAIHAMLEGHELRDRSNLLRGSAFVLHNILLTMQYLRDQSLIKDLAVLSLELTRFLDQIVLNAPPDDPRLKALQELARSEPMWPLLVRPGDNKLSLAKLEKLQVGEHTPIGALPRNAKRPASMATRSNRLALDLVKRIQNRVEACLQIRQDGVLPDSTLEETRQALLRMMEPGIPQSRYSQLVEILHKARKHPFSSEALTQWTGIVSDFVLCVDPLLQTFPELKGIKSSAGAKYAKNGESRLRSTLQKFFSPALKNLARDSRTGRGKSKRKSLANPLSKPLSSQVPFAR